MNETQRILIIDDNPSIHDDFRKILIPTHSNEALEALDAASAAFFGEADTDAGNELNVEVDSAYQGQDGYEKVVGAVKEGRPYALAFCDMRMPPGWDGLTTIEKLCEADPQLQVVICSAYSDNTWDDITTRLGLFDRLLILKKPFDTVEVLQMSVALLEKRRLTSAAEARQDELEQIVRERTQHLNNAREESERFLRAIDSILIGVDEQLRVIRWNQRATDTFGIAAGDALGQLIGELPIKWDDPAAALEVLNVNDDHHSMRTETAFRTSDGEQRVLGLSCYPTDGDEQGALLLGTDLTQRRIVEQQLQQAQKLESVGQLAAGVAHEINTPMQYLGDNLDYVHTKFERLITYLQGIDELINQAEESAFQPDLIAELRQQAKRLKMKKLYDQIPEALQDSIGGVKHVSRIVQAMKEMSHPGGESKVPVEVNHILETTITVSTNEWKYVADIDTNLSPDVGSISGFQGELTQVFLNLIVNASHAISDMTEGGSTGKGLITVSTHRTDEGVIVEIADTGGGIPSSIQDRVFDPFFTTKQVGKGTGQGLAIAHSVVVQKHGGQLSFDVEEGVGTRFIIELPIAETCCSESPNKEDVAGVAE